ncbi:MAG TPA: EscU/YscU/HrcU family type III secretion system export apparatus switch protein [Terriglobales bacterium]|nr:EscU/YscU/HrcU family type III secretion system export apparatus switch protein [Terriglobales bacterium]
MPEANKTEQATPRRRQKAREKGQIARSRELVSSLSALTAVLLLGARGPALAGEWRGMLGSVLDAAGSGDLGRDLPLLMAASLPVLQVGALVLGLAWMAAMVSGVAQGGLVFAPSALAFNPERLNPATRLEQLFSLPALGRLLKSLLPGAAIVYLTLALLTRDWRALLTMPHLALGGVAGFSLGRVFEVAWKSSLVLLIWAGADYLIERRKLESELRMSRQDLKDEYKETEGHPTVKARIRRLQRSARRRRMLEDAKRAAVVITNPAEFAVALEYKPEMPAPVVVAKGRNRLAQEIKEIARWEGIPLVENPPLAHALYRAVEVGQSIPPKLYAVVAGILAAIYRAQERAASARGRKGGR